MKKVIFSPVTAFLINVFPLVMFCTAYFIMPSYSWRMEGSIFMLMRARIAMFLLSIWLGTFLGGLFHLQGVILSVIYLCRNGKTSFGVAISIISIVFPFALWFILINFFEILSQLP